jgi:hypothetical protein
MMMTLQTCLVLGGGTGGGSERGTGCGTATGTGKMVAPSGAIGLVTALGLVVLVASGAWRAFLSGRCLPRVQGPDFVESTVQICPIVLHLFGTLSPELRNKQTFKC